MQTARYTGPSMSVANPQSAEITPSWISSSDEPGLIPVLVVGFDINVVARVLTGAGPG